MQLVDILAACEQIAPHTLALDFDNVGLLVGTTRNDIKKILISLDCTMAVVDEAIEYNADLIITHHPLFFNAVKRFLPDAPETCVAFKLVANNIGLIALHTNLDIANGGVNDTLAKLLKLQDVHIIGCDGLARMGKTVEPIMLSELAQRTQDVLNTTVRIAGDQSRIVSNVAIIGGSGGGEVAEMAGLGADVLITGEIKHAQAIDAMHLGLSVIAAGHFETETIVLNPLIERLQMLTDGVQYKLAVCNAAALVPMKHIADGK